MERSVPFMNPHKLEAAALPVVYNVHKYENLKESYRIIHDEDTSSQYHESAAQNQNLQ